ncbi:TIGR04372 family glycosyltransferase [Pelagibacteraceae bacterium]|nr:TIGR04372 family glycosyltransferase [Pelagibacteraceae bacterium]
MNFIKKQIFDIRKGGMPTFFLKIKSFFKILFNLPIYFLTFPLLILIYLFQKIYLIRLKYVEPNFGLLAIENSIYCCEKELGINAPKSSYLDIFFYKKNVNKQLNKMWKRKLFYAPGFIFYPIYKINRYLSKHFDFAKKHDLKNKMQFEDRDSTNLIQKSSIHLVFSKNEIEEGRKILKKFGLKEDSKFVCLAIRDSAYGKKIYPEVNTDYHSWRNCNIENYLPVCEELAVKGFYIFRMGKIVEKPLLSQNPKIIDYANSNLRSDFMDIYLGANCSFCISSSLGYAAIPYCFKKPIIDLSPLGTISSQYQNSLALPRHYFSKELKRNLSLTEIFKYKLFLTFFTKEFTSRGVEIRENTSKEICDVVNEMIDRIEGKWVEDDEDNILQNKFWKIFKENLVEKKHQMYHMSFNTRIGSRFLKENKNWLN